MKVKVPVTECLTRKMKVKVPVTECLTLAARSITAEEKLLVFFTARPVDSTAFAIPRVLRAGVQGC